MKLDMGLFPQVLLDSFKKKEYDDELRREELLNYFRKFQNTSPQVRIYFTCSHSDGIHLLSSSKTD